MGVSIVLFLLGAALTGLIIMAAECLYSWLQWKQTKSVKVRRPRPIWFGVPDGISLKTGD